MKEELLKKVRSMYSVIYPESWAYHMNHRCHYNAFHYWKKNNQYIASVICLDRWWQIIAHFINYNSKTNTYYENSVWLTNIYKEYYLVKHYSLDEFNDPDAELESLKKLICSFVPYWTRFVNRISYKNF